MKYLLAIFLTLTACGNRDSHDIQDNDTWVYVSGPEYVEDEVPDETDFGPKYISCYSWHTGQPLWGPKPATKVLYEGDYAFIKTYPSGQWVKICAKCYGL